MPEPIGAAKFALCARLAAYPARLRAGRTHVAAPTTWGPQRLRVPVLLLVGVIMNTSVCLPLTQGAVLPLPMARQRVDKMDKMDRTDVIFGLSLYYLPWSDFRLNRNLVSILSILSRPAPRSTTSWLRGPGVAALRPSGPTGARCPPRTRSVSRSGCHRPSASPQGHRSLSR